MHLYYINQGSLMTDCGSGQQYLNIKQLLQHVRNKATLIVHDRLFSNNNNSAANDADWLAVAGVDGKV